MTAAPALGLAYIPTHAPESLHGIALGVERAGLDELWVWEDCFASSAVASAAVVLAWTSQLRVGIGLMPTPLRNVALSAMEMAVLERTFPGRLIAGVGHGVQDWMAQVGAKVASPLTLLEEYTVALRRLLAGEEVTVDGRYVHLDQVALDWAPKVSPTLMVGGAGPKSVTLAARIGDGNLLTNVMTDDEIAHTVALVTAERGPGHPVVYTQIAATGPGADERLAAEVPRWGKPADLGIGVAGDAEAIADSIRRLGRLGVTSVAIQPTRDEPDLDGLIALLGSEVKPRLDA